MSITVSPDQAAREMSRRAEAHERLAEAGNLYHAVKHYLRSIGMSGASCPAAHAMRDMMEDIAVDYRASLADVVRAGLAADGPECPRVAALRLKRAVLAVEVDGGDPMQWGLADVLAVQS